MFKIEDNQIWLTKGDTAEFRPVVEDYVAAETDKILFAVNRTYSDTTPVIRKEIAAGNNIEFEKADTADLKQGTYLFQIKLITEDSISTFSTGRFNLLGDLDNGND